MPEPTASDPRSSILDRQTPKGTVDLSRLPRPAGSPEQLLRRHGIETRPVAPPPPVSLYSPPGEGQTARRALERALAKTRPGNGN